MSVLSFIFLRVPHRCTCFMWSRREGCVCPLIFFISITSIPALCGLVGRDVSVRSFLYVPHRRTCFMRSCREGCVSPFIFVCPSPAYVLYAVL